MNATKKYAKVIRSIFPIWTKNEKHFFTDLKGSIVEFCADRENISFDDLVQKFGTPTDIVHDYLGGVTTEYLYKQLSRSRHIRFTCYFATIGIVIMLIIGSAYNYISYREFQEQLPAIEETTIIVYPEETE